MKPDKSLKSYIYERDGHLCNFCSKNLKYKQMSLDHYLPKSKGGPDDVFNLVLSCKKCNSYKKNIIPEDFYDILIKLFKKAVQDKMINIPKNYNENNIKQQLLSVNRMILTRKYTLFENDRYRFYIDSNRLIKVVQFGCYNKNSDE